MKVLVMFLVTIAAADLRMSMSYQKFQNGQEKIDLSKAGALFQQFMIDYNRYYEDKTSRLMHYKAFKKTLKVINEANAAESIYGARFGITSFADYTAKEMRRYMSLLKAAKDGKEENN